MAAEQAASGGHAYSGEGGVSPTELRFVFEQN